MRKQQKKQVEEFLKVLAEAHTEIKKQLQKNAIAKVQELLQQCQQGAIQLGSLIESVEGEDAITVRYLEEYCETIYGIYEEVEQNQDVAASHVYEMLHRQQVRIENSVRNDIPLRKEAVFLPYKASMWDSLESVWRAADEDPDCDAYVIPIPYYDRNPDGSFREMHYEGNQYPKDVPVTGYEAYDFEKRRPDMIFIHNPYDDCNYVTSVPPFFYSKNLKQYTDCLVYIPYFVLGEVEPDNEQAVKGMEHFCTVPGVVNADKVVVQSEKMRRIYIDVLTRYAGKDTKKYWENKILGIGSPKVDKVLSTKIEDLEIPEEWKKILEKPVMLYSIGKDSSVMLHLAMKAFYPEKPPFPFLHIDTTWKFKEMIAFRDRIAKEKGIEMLVYTNEEGIRQGINPFDHSSAYTDIMKTEALKQALSKYGFTAAFGGGWRDEEKSRAKERIFSFRNSEQAWDPKNQRPEMWKQYNTRLHKGESMRVFPLSNWTEKDIWQYIAREQIEIVPL